MSKIGEIKGIKRKYKILLIEKNMTKIIRKKTEQKKHKL